MTDKQIKRLARKHLKTGDDGEIFGVVKFAHALLSASIADTAGAMPEPLAPDGFWEWFKTESRWNYRGALYDNAFLSAKDGWNAAIRYAAPPVPSVADAAGAIDAQVSAFQQAWLERARRAEADLQALRDDIIAIDTWYRGSPSYEHDAGWFKDRVLRAIDERIEELEAELYEGKDE